MGCYILVFLGRRITGLDTLDLFNNRLPRLKFLNLNSFWLLAQALQLGKLLHAVLPRFYRGMFHLDNKGSEEAKQRWLDAVNKATTVSRCHLLLGILASLVIWDMSAEHAV